MPERNQHKKVINNGFSIHITLKEKWLSKHLDRLTISRGALLGRLYLPVCKSSNEQTSATIPMTKGGDSCHRAKRELPEVILAKTDMTPETQHILKVIKAVTASENGHDILRRLVMIDSASTQWGPSASMYGNKVRWDGGKHNRVPRAGEGNWRETTPGQETKTQWWWGKAWDTLEGDAGRTFWQNPH